LGGGLLHRLCGAGIGKVQGFGGRSVHGVSGRGLAAGVCRAAILADSGSTSVARRAGFVRAIRRVDAGCRAGA
jgi:hypothetical protein